MANEEKWKFSRMGDHQLAMLPRSWDTAPASASSSEQQLAAARRQPAVVWRQPAAVASAASGSGGAAASSSSEQQYEAASLRLQVISDSLPNQLRPGRQLTPTRAFRKHWPTVVVLRIWQMKKSGKSGGSLTGYSARGSSQQRQPAAASSGGGQQQAAAASNSEQRQ